MIGSDTPPHPAPCRRCLAITLEAWVDGLHTHTDLTALSISGQVHALESGRDLYELHMTVRGTRANAWMVVRDESRINSGKPHIALASHECGKPLTGYTDKGAQRRLDQWRNPSERKAETGPPPY